VREFIRACAGACEEVQTKTIYLYTGYKFLPSVFLNVNCIL